MTNARELEAARRIAHVTPLTTLAEKVAPPHTALLVIDMQNDFCAPGGLVSKDGRDISEAAALAQRLPAFIDAAQAAGVPVILIRDVHTTDANHYHSDVWLEQAARKRKGGYTTIPVCCEGSWEGDFVDHVRPLPGEPVVTKHRYWLSHHPRQMLIFSSSCASSLQT